MNLKTFAAIFIALLIVSAPSFGQASVFTTTYTDHYTPATPFVATPGSSACLVPLPNLIYFTNGERDTRFQFTSNSNGFSVNWHINMHVSDGTALGSQEVFQGAESFKYSFNFGKTGNYIVPQRSKLWIRGDKNSSFVVTMLLVLQFDADTGANSVRVERAEVECN